MAGRFQINAQDWEPSPELPLYRQLHEKLKGAISAGDLAAGDRLPASRELANQLGWNRATVAAAYKLLESEGLIKQFVGRGSFVAGPQSRKETSREWTTAAGPRTGIDPRPTMPEAPISFAASRPSELLFPLEEFRVTCREVIESPEAAQILQLGSAGGYGPLRRYLLDSSRMAGIAGDDDDVLITNGCQQAFDLIQRVYASSGETVLIEDPVYPGLRNVFTRGGARVLGVPLGNTETAIDLEVLGRQLEKEHPRLLILSPSYQNPTGLSIPETARLDVLERVAQAARMAGTVLIEVDLYGALRTHGRALPRMKELDRRRATVLLSSFSKIAFPGLRVGWVCGPRHFIARLVEAKEITDLHTDQLAQAILLRFAESSRLQKHIETMVGVCRDRLVACLEACDAELPPEVEFTRPTGGMNLWVRLREGMDASSLAVRAAQAGVGFLPGRYFAVSRPHTNAFRLSYAGLEPEKIRTGVAVLGRLIRAEMREPAAGRSEELSPVLV